MCEAIGAEAGLSAREAAEGFVRIAVDNMASAIKRISIARGHDVTRYTLACFGGAGGQHACLVADALGMERVMIHPLAGVLSAYGMGLADMVELRQRSVGGEALEDVLADAGGGGGGGAAGAGGGGGGAEAAGGAEVRGERFAASRWRRASSRRCGRRSRRRTGRGSGSSSPETAVVVETAIVEAVVLPIAQMGRGTMRSMVEGSLAQACRLPLHHPSGGPPPHAAHGEDDVIDRATLAPGALIPGPALIIDPSATTVVEPGWQAEVDPLGNLILTRSAPRETAHAIGTDADPVMLEVFNNLFMAVAEEMGVALQNTASLGQHQGAARFLLRPVRLRRRSDRQRAAHPGPSRLDGRFDPHHHRGARTEARATGAASGRATSMCSTPPIAAAPICPTSP